MHRSRFAGLIIDCQTDNLNAAADFWSAAPGYPRKETDNVQLYAFLSAPDNEPYVEVQKVAHASRVHIDIEADDIDAEAARLETHGARRIERIKDWWVMEAPTGQRFCVVPPVSKHFDATANQWD
ncbi:MAG: VOC family protein [Proteobacteria bacterium]|nr:VOC family protein [Pseudomonadota bacterium]